MNNPVKTHNKNASTSHAGKHTSTPSSSNPKKRLPPPFESLYYKSDRQVNVKYYCFHCVAFGHSDDKCFVQHDYPTEQRQNNGPPQLQNLPQQCLQHLIQISHKDL